MYNCIFKLANLNEYYDFVSLSLWHKTFIVKKPLAQIVNNTLTKY